MKNKEKRGGRDVGSDEEDSHWSGSICLKMKVRTIDF
jgi:hypothetical protein